MKQAVLCCLFLGLFRSGFTREAGVKKSQSIITNNIQCELEEKKGKGKKRSLNGGWSWKRKSRRGRRTSEKVQLRCRWPMTERECLTAHITGEKALPQREP